MPKKILIFGGTGFLGRHLYEKLEESSYEVHFVIRPETAKPNWIASEQVTSLKVEEIGNEDLGNKEIDALKAKKFDVVINLIGNANPNIDERESIETNFSIPCRIVKLAEQLQVKQFIHFSSIATRSGGVGVISDHSPLRPRSSVYAKSKTEFEIYLQSNKSDMAIGVLSPCFMIGCYDRKMNSNAFLLQLYFRRWTRCVDVIKNIVSPRDVARAAQLAIEKGLNGSVIVGGHNVSTQELLRRSCDLMGRKYNLLDFDDLSSLPTEFEREFFCASKVELSPLLKSYGYVPQIEVDAMLLDALSDLAKRKLLSLSPDLSLTVHSSTYGNEQ